MAERPDLSAVVAAVHAGDCSAMEALDERYAAQLVRYSAVCLSEAEGAQDVVQEASSRSGSARGRSTIGARPHWSPGSARSPTTA